MFKKILTYIGWSLLILTLGAYFFFAARLRNAAKDKEVCKYISVRLLDSTQNKFVAKSEVIDIIEEFGGQPLGKRRSEIDLGNIENLLNRRSAIKESQVSINRNGVLSVDITQRKPMLRIQTENGGFYVDRTGYIFPLVKSFSSYVPIVTGYIPLTINAEHRGKILEDGDDWIGKIIKLGVFIEENPFWNAMIEQIYVEDNGDIILCPKVGNQHIIIGDLSNIESKFNRLLAFYKNIAPYEGWNRYSAVNLKYKNQIICKVNKDNRKKKQQ